VLVRAAPEARLVVLVGDPVAGVVADLGRTASLRPPHPGTWLSDAVDRGFVAEHLARLSDAVPAGQVLVVQAERCAAEPEAELARCFAFVGLDPAAASPGGLPGPAHPASPVLDADVLDRLRHLFADDVARLAAMVPDLDLGLWTTTVP
jgi:hypothetical protein